MSYTIAGFIIFLGLISFIGLYVSPKKKVKEEKKERLPDKDNIVTDYEYTINDLVFHLDDGTTQDYHQLKGGKKDGALYISGHYTSNYHRPHTDGNGNYIIDSGLLNPNKVIRIENVPVKLILKKTITFSDWGDRYNESVFYQLKEDQ